MASPTVQLRVEEDNRVVMDNGIVQVYLSNSGGFVTRIQYNGIDNLLEALSRSDHRGHVMLGNSPGFYFHAIFEHLKEWHAFNIPQIRIV